MKALDLTNQRFGKLVARSRAPKRNDRYTRWLCECDCGSWVEVRTDFLRNLHTTSCGCEKAIHFSSQVEIGKQYGRLKVDHYDNLHGVYVCECECGNITVVKGYNLINGNTQSCGCLKSKGEFKLNNLLTEMGIKFTTQHSFTDCRFPDSDRLAYFDYAIFSDNKLLGLIEYDGEQHRTGWGGQVESLNKIQARDKFKEYYCCLHEIPLVRIPSTDYSRIDAQYLENIIRGMSNEASNTATETV